MAMSAKGTRSITVDGERYRFRGGHSDLGIRDRSTVVVEAWEGGQRLLARFDPWVLTGAEPEPYFSKRLVRMVILEGLARGWRPRERGRQRILEEDALFGEHPPPRPAPPALLQAIFAAPEDDAPRLVLADWLLERGDRRGELIVLQCAEATRAITDEGRERIVRLLSRHWRRWSAPARLVARRWRFERGFIASLTCLGAPERAAWEQLHRLEPVQSLELRCQGEERLALAWLPQPTTLRLQLSGAVGDQGIAALLRSPHLGRLRELVCTSAGLTDAAATLLANAAELATLEELDLRYNEVTAEGERELRDSRALPRLKRISI